MGIVIAYYTLSFGTYSLFYEGNNCKGNPIGIADSSKFYDLCLSNFPDYHQNVSGIVHCQNNEYQYEYFDNLHCKGKPFQTNSTQIECKINPRNSVLAGVGENEAVLGSCDRRDIEDFIDSYHQIRYFYDEDIFCDETKPYQDFYLNNECKQESSGSKIISTQITCNEEKEFSRRSLNPKIALANPLNLKFTPVAMGNVILTHL